MVGQSASKAEQVPAVTMDGRHNLIEVLALDTTLYSVFAVGCGAPLEIFFVVDVRSCKERVVSVNVNM